MEKAGKVCQVRSEGMCMLDLEVWTLPSSSFISLLYCLQNLKYPIICLHLRVQIFFFLSNISCNDSKRGYSLSK